MRNAPKSYPLPAHAGRKVEPAPLPPPRFPQIPVQSIFETVGSPRHFKPVRDIPEQEFDQAWQQVSDYLETYHIRLGVCSPHIASRELYRFAVEEFFRLDIEAPQLPGVNYVYYYDNFYPDPFYENTELVVRCCIPDLLKKDRLWGGSYLSPGPLQLNQHAGLSLHEYLQRANAFKDYFEQVVIREIEDTRCQVRGEESVVRGRYAIDGICGNEVLPLQGNWSVVLEPDAERYFWYVKKVWVEGLPF